MKLAAVALFWRVDSSYYNNTTTESGKLNTLEGSAFHLFCLF